MPVAAAIGAGRVAVDSGSRIARSGASGKSRMTNLMPRSGSLITATGLASEPVPAVVGITASGASGSGLPIPSRSRGSRRRPPSRESSPPWLKITFAALVVSITEPPPTARKLSAPWLLRLLAHAAHHRGVGVLRDVVEDADDLEPAVGEPRLDLLDQTRAADHLVGDHQHPLGALLGELEAGAPDQLASGDHPGRCGELVEVLEGQALDQIGAALGLELGLVAREDRLRQRHQLEDLRHRALGLDLAPRQRHGDVHLAEPEPVRGVGLHRHRHLGLHLGLAEVDVARLALLEAHGDRRLGLAVLVADDRVRLAELRRQLLVLGEVREQLADRVVDLLGVLEVGQVLSSPRARDAAAGGWPDPMLPRPRTPDVDGRLRRL